MPPSVPVHALPCLVLESERPHGPVELWFDLDLSRDIALLAYPRAEVVLQATEAAPDGALTLTLPAIAYAVQGLAPDVWADLRRAGGCLVACGPVGVLGRWPFPPPSPSA